MSEKAPRLVPFICPQCGRHLMDAVPTAQIWCKRCRQWVRSTETGRNANAPA